ncbi:MAG: hypothetical protein IJW15_01015 [Clostridia bacterium]|nr:hypothetical protein [Clostridia bacterium]
MTNEKMNSLITSELNKYVPMLEHYFKYMVDVEFVVENDKFYLLSAREGKCTDLSNLRILISMFCEGVIEVNELIKRIPYLQLQRILNIESIINTDELIDIGKGLGVSGGVGIGMACFSNHKAQELIKGKEDFIYCQYEIYPEDVKILESKYCQGVITARGGMTSHAAVVCRGRGLPCVTGFGEYDRFENRLSLNKRHITINGSNGKIYDGFGIVQKNYINSQEIKMLFHLLKITIKYNITNAETAPLVWRLWNVVLGKRYFENTNEKQMVVKNAVNYKSFNHPSEQEMDVIYSNLYNVSNANLIIEDLIDFLQYNLSSQVPLGNHYLYMRPLLDPEKTICFVNDDFYKKSKQLTGIEFFNTNRYVDFLLDIYSIKIYFYTERAICKDTPCNEKSIYNYINYLDYTNPNGESIIINTYNAKKISVYINEVLIPAEDLPMVYHLLRRREHHWSWYEENNITKREIINYLSSDRFINERNKSKIFYLCEEMNLIKNSTLTEVGKSLIGE